MDEYITRNNAISAVCLGCNQQFSDEPCEPSDCTIRRSIMALPTADVAPRAEVEYWKEQCFHACMNNGCLDKAIVKAAVAREIFEEIERSVYKLETPYQVLHCIPTGYLAELKKKYTEGQK